ncbi:hypothetical protein VE01_01632 [Pseudogymnoascus verrucosus]|uniref:Uncharacterized protein n=1 Tax=Pseudogymnoascus verrucosus TaxID=342668 RepID=A0A1B8GWN1_9PEZI|nr:uncharacterized protein VE01_01632 [Pseudogymnoascus verrucosus]OBU00245.1 hypothetical protein VE01_01632 [Pseudogymnoascus verrucosus]
MAQQYGHISAQFESTISSFTNESGFVVVRTAYADDDATDAAQWSTALAKLQELTLPSDKFALPVIADPALKGASYDAVRTAFNTWVNNYEEGHMWQSDVRRDCCLVLDGPALASLLQAPEQGGSPKQATGQTRRSKQPAPVPWVVVVDGNHPSTIPYNGGGPYLGWMRVPAHTVEDLFVDIEVTSLVEACPTRVYDGQLPLYGRELIDPEGGVEGRYKFPQGTPRGVDAGNAMLDDIERALGKEAVTQSRGVSGKVRQRGSVA